MKYFLNIYQSWRWDETDEEAELSLAKHRDACTAYERRIQSIASKLDPEVLAITDPFYVDDAIVSQLMIDRINQRLDLTLRCGNIPNGYFDLKLTYKGAEMEASHEQTLREVAMETTGGTCFANECYCHELDVLDDGRLEHRFQFHEADWFPIRCGSLRVERVEQSSREIPPLSERVRVLPVVDR